MPDASFVLKLTRSLPSSFHCLIREPDATSATVTASRIFALSASFRAKAGVTVKPGLQCVREFGISKRLSSSGVTVKVKAPMVVKSTDAKGVTVTPSISLTSAIERV